MASGLETLRREANDVELRDKTASTCRRCAADAVCDPCQLGAVKIADHPPSVGKPATQGDGLGFYHHQLDHGRGIGVPDRHALALVAAKVSENLRSRRPVDRRQFGIQLLEHVGQWPFRSDGELAGCNQCAVATGR